MRIKRLDILRCAAVLLVVVSHSGIFDLTVKVGWVGVDLFFVLSGFLISGLLYSEYKKRGDISFRRFFIRRGLKIYPAFYVLLLATYVGQLLFWHAPPQSLSSYLHEIFFIQNYRYGVWGHTWSLAVEEHFYIALAALLLVLARYSSDRKDPFNRIPQIFVGVAVTCLMLRILTLVLMAQAKDLTPHVMNPTHTRIDALFFGVLLGYLYHFRPETISRICRPRVNRIAIGALSAILLSCCYFFSRDDHFLLSFGLTFLYLGFGGLLVLSLMVRDVLPRKVARFTEKIGTGCAYVGTHSYSIYLWHTPILVYFPLLLRKVAHIQPTGVPVKGIYIVACCVLGIAMANLIELPVLRLRDRFFPRLQQPAVNSLSVSASEPLSTSETA
jgi:peptidoglycan/LPS O-acetylase OafA/YrhL